MDFTVLNEYNLTPFEWNSKTTSPLFDLDPDMQFYRVSTELSIKSSCMSLLCYNVRSLVNKLSRFQELVSELNWEFDIIGITETWINENNYDLFSLPNYHEPYQKYRTNKKGGGVLLYVRDSIQYKIRPDLHMEQDFIENIFIEIESQCLNTTKNVIIGLIYRVPDSNIDLFNKELSDILQKITKENKFIYLMGDYNLDLLKCAEHEYTQEFLDTMYANNLIPTITKPTRPKTKTLIDNIFTNNYQDNQKQERGIIYADLSDHLPIYNISKNINIADNTDCFVWKRKKDRASVQAFINTFSSYDWSELLSVTDGQIAYDLFHNKLIECYENHLPMKMIKLNKYKARLPWLNDTLKEAIKQKNVLYVKQLRTKNEDDIKFYKSYRNTLTKLLRHAERKHYHDLLEEHKSDLKASWKILKTVINKGTKGKLPKLFRDGEKEVTNPKDIADRFNKFFTNIGPTLAKSIPKSSSLPLKYLNEKIKESVLFSPVLENEVKNILMLLKNSAAGWDGFDAQIIKQIKDFIISPFTHICNLSITTGVFPRQMKTANTVPIYKSGDNTLFNNYRPVSVLPLFSKILERIVYNRLIEFFNKHNVLYDYQFGFRKLYSTHMALITLIDKLSNALDEGSKVVGIFLDFSKAFDTIDHDILLLKLEHYGVRGLALDWFKNYLNSRFQYVMYNGIKSYQSQVTCGVPQGSILGPLLFLIYVNDLHNVVKNALLLLFADDSNLFYTGNDMVDITEKINDDLQHLTEWLASNKLSLNIKKTNYMIFHSGYIAPDDINITIRNEMIGRVYSTKFVGVLIDSKLNWKCHIHYINNKLSKCIGIMIKARKKLPKSSLLTLYYTFAYPYLLYCIHVWGRSGKTVLKLLSKTQNRLVRIITSSGYRTNTESLYQNIKVLKVPEIYDYAIGVFMYKLYHGYMPSIFQCIFVVNRATHEYGTRQKDHYKVPKFKLQVVKNSVRYRGVIIWNMILQNIDITTSLQTFKFHLRQGILSTLITSVSSNDSWHAKPIMQTNKFAC